MTHLRECGCCGCAMQRFGASWVCHECGRRDVREQDAIAGRYSAATYRVRKGDPARVQAYRERLERERASR